MLNICNSGFRTAERIQCFDSSGVSACNRSPRAALAEAGSEIDNSCTVHGLLVISVTIFRETIRESTSWETLVYVGVQNADNDATAAETMATHVQMLCNWLAGIDEVPEHHRSLPWRSVLCVNERRFPMFLETVRADWAFIQKLDVLHAKSPLRKMMLWTTWQPVREILVESEPLDPVIYGFLCFL